MRARLDQFDVTGRFDFDENLPPMDHFRDIALAERPDLQAAMETVTKAETDHKLAVANGSTDPTFSMDIGRNPPITAYFGVSVRHSAANFRSQSRRENADRDRY